MASSFFALIDDIAYLMDEVATMSKVATKKAAGVLSDDLAVNAEKASGFLSSRELPVLWKITKGSFINKLIILPFAFLMSVYIPLAVTIILILGGVYLGYEGVQKIVDYLFYNKREKKEQSKKKLEILTNQAIQIENKKVKGAIFVDFILSIEIIIIALGTVIESPLKVQILVVSFIAFMATIGVYGLVALIVRMDDIGFKLIKISNNKPSFLKNLGILLVKTLPILIRILTVVGTFAMLLVSGGILIHNIPQIHDLFHLLPSTLKELLVGLIVGSIVVINIKAYKRIKSKK